MNVYQVERYEISRWVKVAEFVGFAEAKERAESESTSPNGFKRTVRINVQTKRGDYLTMWGSWQ